MKISLEELKARSKGCGAYPRLVEIAREAKSPTAASEIAASEDNGNTLAQACRYLAMIKRDYGKAVFEQVAKEIRAETNRVLAYAQLLPFIQTANRLSYLFEKTGMRQESLAFPPCDSDYVDVVEGLLEEYAVMFLPLREELLAAIDRNTTTAQLYLDEAEMFVKCTRASNPTVDHYCLEKTVRVLDGFTCVIARRAGVPDSALVTHDYVHAYSQQQRKAKT